MLQIKDLSFSYKDRLVLKEINFHIEKGEILALVGPNGSGKSTLLRCMNAFLKPRSGQVMLAGTDIRKQSRKWIARHIALLPQNLEPVQNITCYELVSMGRSPYQLFGWVLTENDRKIIEWAIEYMDLQSFRDRLFNKLSGGERQRAWIAMILAQDTDVVLLDEPITYLDIKYQWYFLDVIRRIRNEYGKTFVLVLHDINQAMMVADSFVVLKAGRVYSLGKGSEIVTSDLLRKVYEVSANVCAVPGYRRPVILPAENVDVVEKKEVR